jgi:uncharacterized membrane protein
MQGKANFRGHPLHLILVSFPVAFWSGSLLTDGAGVWLRDAFWFHMSVVQIAMGTAIALPAAMCGYIDYRTVRMTRKARGLANGHFIWSAVAIAVFTAAFLARMNDWSAPWGIALTVAGAVVLLVGAYLGSELANRFRIGVLEPPSAETTPARP